MRFNHCPAQETAIWQKLKRTKIPSNTCAQPCTAPHKCSIFHSNFGNTITLRLMGCAAATLLACTIHGTAMDSNPAQNSTEKSLYTVVVGEAVLKLMCV